MICPNCGTIMDSTDTKCDCCGYTVTNPPTTDDTYEGSPDYNISPDFNDSDSSGQPQVPNWPTIVGWVIAIIVIVAIIAASTIATNPNIDSDSKYQQKYSNLKKDYGLSKREIEENISWYYRMWYEDLDDALYSAGNGDSFYIDDKEVVYSSNRSFDYKIFNITRKNKDEILKIDIEIGEDRFRLIPYSNEKEGYDYIKFIYIDDAGNLTDYESIAYSPR